MFKVGAVEPTAVARPSGPDHAGVGLRRPRAAALTSMPTELLYQEGLRLLGARDWTGAVRELRQAVAAQPGHAEARVALGRALAALGELEGAERLLLEALRLRPELVDALIELGAVLALSAGWCGSSSRPRRSQSSASSASPASRRTMPSR